MKQRKSDILWKVILEEMFSDLLRFIYPDADEVYDMERGFEFLDGDLYREGLRGNAQPLYLSIQGYAFDL